MEMPDSKRRRTGEHPIVSRALVNTRDTPLYRRRFYLHTVKSARLGARIIGATKWYTMKKNALISIIVLDDLVRRIQRFFRTRGGSVRDRAAMIDGLKGEMCPITLGPISDLSIQNRYWHSNTWFDREGLVQFLRISCDFIHPVTRVAFTREDVNRIDSSLMVLYDSRLSLRSAMVSQMETIQCVENELEDIFKEMIDMACVTPTRNEFNVIMSYSENKFEECFKDLVRMDKERCILALKSLPDLIEGDAYTRVYISRKRGNELRELVREFIYRVNYET